jgi:hypothetical protein
MEADELTEVDQRLRAICSQRGLSWVVADVDCRRRVKDDPVWTGEN